MAQPMDTGLCNDGRLFGVFVSSATAFFSNTHINQDISSVQVIHAEVNNASCSVPTRFSNGDILRND